ncbi:hypothetical protein [Sphingomonas sp. LY160]|uniref:hypothetical protein n=1 Tax=Sphingomonas sp. LY160 TaxID=3095342 RepID=UPI002ADEC042|nr:hypothetical protein [Sphingomonas sp. LY160]MEA1073002.1 hypothetical protein [Sphingomonas sp. LY160]
MAKRTPAAGGIFLFLTPIVGALYGAGRGEPIQWMLVGFAVGVVIALVVWLIDRRRG